MGRSPTDTKTKLIETAIALIWKNSYGSVSVDDICKAADVKKGSFYHFFKSKAELAMEAVEAFYERSKPFYDAAFSPSIPPLARFETLADMAYERQKAAVEEHGHVCGCPFATIGSEMAGQDEDMRRKIDDVFRRYERYYESAIRDMVAERILPDHTDVKRMAADIYGFMIGQMLMARIQNSLEPLKRDLKPGLMRVLGVQPERQTT